MKYQLARVISFFGLLLLVSVLSGCGNTMYGIGIDMDRIGQRIQGQHRQNWGGQANGYGQPTTQQYPAQPYGPAYGQQQYPYQGGVVPQSPTGRSQTIPPRYPGR